MSDDPLLEIALSVTDDDPIDWQAHDSRVAGEDRALLQRLRQIHTLAQLHQAPQDGTALQEPFRDALVLSAATPPRWGPLEIIEKVGSGSYGDVYLARDPRLDRTVALKLLRRGSPGAQNESSVVHEGHLLSRVRHQNVVTVYGAERIDGRSGLWMEFIEGETLESELQRRRPLPPEEVAQLGIALCRALEAVHAAGLLHRDVKAQNIMRDRTGRLILMDFGAGHDAQDAATYERLAGTPAYLAPEILAGGPPAAAMDIYACGVVLFRLATGRFPVEGSTVRQLRKAHDRGRLPSLASLRPDFPRPLARAIERAICADPSKRFTHVTDMRSALEGSTESQRRGSWRRRVAAGVLITSIGTAGWLAHSAGIFGPQRFPANAPDPRLRTAWADAGAAGVHFGTVSHNGRRVSSLGLDTPALLVRDLLAGTTLTLLSGAATSGPEFSAMSRDGAQVAYTWRTDGRYELRVASATAEDATHRVVVPHDPARFNYIIPCDWSPDGTQILAMLRRDGAVIELAVVDMADGSLRVLKRGYWGRTLRAVFSIDGSHVAANLPTDRAALQQDIFLFRLDRGKGALETARITGPSHDVVAGWSPDGTRLLFLSDRAGTTGLWAIDVLNGEPRGESELLRPDISGTPLGVVESGALLMAVAITNRDIYVAAVDFETGRTISSPARPVSRYIGSIRSPSFSPDGRLLAYLSDRTGIDGGVYLVLQSLADGGVRHLRLSTRNLLQLSWSPDSQAVIGVGAAEGSGAGMYRINITTGEATLLGRDGDLPQLSRDEAKLYYRRPFSGPPYEFVERTLASGRERILLRNEDSMYPAVSPDGQHIATVLATRRETKRSLRRLVVVSVEGGEARDLFRSDELTFLARWTPDSRTVLIANAGRLGAVPIGGGAPHWLDLQILPPPQREEHLAVHPDGQQVVYMTGGSKMELWSLEKYLPGR